MTFIRSTGIVAAVGSAFGAVLMFIIGAVSVYDAYDLYFSDQADKAGHAGIDATALVVTALDEFLFGLFLLFFAYGVFVLFVVPDPDTFQRDATRIGVPTWMQVYGLGDLKTKLLEVIVVLFAVSFLRIALEEANELEWTSLVIPIAMVSTGAVIWLVRHSDHDHHPERRDLG